MAQSVWRGTSLVSIYDWFDVLGWRRNGVHRVICQWWTCVRKEQLNSTIRAILQLNTCVHLKCDNNPILVLLKSKILKATILLKTLRRSQEKKLFLLFHLLYWLIQLKCGLGIRRSSGCRTERIPTAFTFTWVFKRFFQRENIFGLLKHVYLLSEFNYQYRKEKNSLQIL